MSKFLKTSAGKKNKIKPPIQQQAKPMEPTNAQNPEEKPIHEQHKDFLKSAEETVEKNKPQLENVDNATTFENPTIERDYNTAGYKKPEGAEPEFSPTNPTETATGKTEFEATPPPKDDPDYADPHIPSDTQDDGLPFTFPEGSAEDMVDMGAGVLNYLIEKYSPIFMAIKIRPEYYTIRDNRKSAIDIISEFNDKAKTVLQLSDKEISMLKKPIVKLLAEKGIKGMTPSQELLAVALVIVAGKAKDMADFRNERKQMQNHFDSMIKYMRAEKGFKEPETDTQFTASAPPVSDDDLPFTPTEEIK